MLAQGFPDALHRPTTTRRAIRVSLAVAATLVLSGVCHGGGPYTYYVRKTGNDSNSGLSASDALRTISKAEDKVSAGDTVYVGAGTYSERVEIKANGNGLTSVISFIADTDGSQTGDAGDVVIDGGDSRDECVKLKHCQYVRIRGFCIKRAKKKGLHLDKPRNVWVESCRVYDNKEHGIEAKEIRDTVISDCHVYDNGKVGIKLHVKDGGGCVLVRCVVYGNDEEGIKAKSKDSGLSVIANCICYGNKKDGIEIEDRHSYFWVGNNTLVDNQEKGFEQKDASQVFFVNNIVAYNKDLGVKRNNGSLTNDYNLFWCNKETTSTHWVSHYDGGSPGEHDFVADPTFLDRGASDYHLAGASPAINAGTATAAPSDDFEGQARSAGDGHVDIGADEAGARRPVVTSWRQVER